MRRFTCPGCRGPLFFDNTACGACGAEVVYDLAADAFHPLAGDACRRRSTPERCNWRAEPDGTCASCRLDTTPDPADDELAGLRAPFEGARRRALRQLTRLDVPWVGVEPPLRFELLRGTDEQPVTIGHADGLITLDLAEGDPTRLATVRNSLGEPYRTPLGHVRHEMGHWFWQAQVDQAFSLADSRAVFGDERTDYAAALEQHYSHPDDGTWRGAFVSHYAASHPWEDFAESFAHLLHLTDTLETARWGGLAELPAGEAAIDLPFDDVYRAWVDVTVTLNELTRSMGMADAYPFAVSQPAVDKIAFVGEAVRRCGRPPAPTGAPIRSSFA